MERINEEQNCQIAELTAEVNWITVHCLTYIKSAFLMLRINELPTTHATNPVTEK